MEHTLSNLKLATKVTETLKSVNIEEDYITSISFDQYGASAQLKNCPEAYSFINAMQAKVKLRVQSQRSFSSGTYDFVMTHYLTSTQLRFQLTIGTPTKK